MKKQLLIFILLIISKLVISQNGTYTCDLQKFTNLNDSTKNKTYYKTYIITIDINETLGGYVLIHETGTDLNLKWNVLSKEDFYFDSNENTMYIKYDARFVLLNVQGNRKLNVIIGEYLIDKTFFVQIYDPELKTTNGYYNFIKI